MKKAGRSRPIFPAFLNRMKQLCREGSDETWIDSLSVRGSAADRLRESYWTESCGDCEVTLRDSGNTEKAVEIVVTVDGEETILKTLAVPAERISAEAFTDILGYSGFRLTERQGGWPSRTQPRTGACGRTMPWRTARCCRLPRALDGVRHRTTLWIWMRTAVWSW